MSEKLVQSHKSLPAASVKSTSKVSERVSPEMESSMEEELSQVNIVYMYINILIHGFVSILI